MPGIAFSDVLTHVGLMNTMPGDDVLEHQVLNHWRDNDERYIRRGEKAAVDEHDWHRSLMRVNNKRRGRPFVLPPEMVEPVRRMMIEQHLSYRAAEGHLRRMLSALGMKAPDHTTIWKRLAAEQAPPNVSPRRAIVAVDATGFTITLRGEWLRDRWHKHRGFVKAHVTVDVGTLEVLAVVITDDTVGDNVMFSALIEQVLARGIIVERLLADGAYDTYDNFDLLHERGIDAGIKMAEDAVTRSKGHTRARPYAVRERNALGQEAWEEWYDCSLRWMIEYVFSAVKRTLGDDVRSRRRDLMFSEVENKFWTWNEMRRTDLCN